MAYFNKLSFAIGYFTIQPDGVIRILKPMPPEMRERFWRTWVEFRKEIIAAEKQFIFVSYHPYIPITEEDPNAPQYADLNIE